MSSRSRTVAAYSSRFKRRMGAGPGVTPAAQASVAQPVLHPVRELLALIDGGSGRSLRRHLTLLNTARRCAPLLWVRLEARGGGEPVRMETANSGLAVMTVLAIGFQERLRVVERVGSFLGVQASAGAHHQCQRSDQSHSVESRHRGRSAPAAYQECNSICAFTARVFVLPWHML